MNKGVCNCYKCLKCGVSMTSFPPLGKCPFCNMFVDKNKIGTLGELVELEPRKRRLKK